MINSYPVRTLGVRDPHSSCTRTVGARESEVHL
jgi:hypothetical protein